MNKWDARFMNLAMMISEWSKDNSTKCGCVIVDDKKRIVSTGYNGFPLNTDDSDELYRDRDTKLLRVLHAELNAILFARGNVDNCTLYVYPFPPCSQCSAAIIQYGIKRVVTLHPSTELQERWSESLNMGKKMFEEAGIILDYLK